MYVWCSLFILVCTAFAGLTWMIGIYPEKKPFCKTYLWSVSIGRAHLQIVWRVDRGNRAAEHLVQVLLSLSLVALVVAFLCRVPVLVLRAKPIWTGGTHYISPSAVLFHGLVDHLLCFSYFPIFFLFLWSADHLIGELDPEAAASLYLHLREISE